MPTHRFVMIVSSTPTAEQAGTLVALPDRPLVERRTRQGNGRISFERDGVDLVEAVISAMRDMEAVGLQPVRVVNDDWVTMADIAERIGRSRESIRLWSLGRVGPGGFPPPLNPGRDTSFYSWLEVNIWLRERSGKQAPEPDAGLVVADLVVRLRALARQLKAVDLMRTSFDA